VTATVEASQQSLLALRSSRVLPYPADPTGAFTRFGAYDDGRLLADHTEVRTTPTAAGRGVVAAVWVEPERWPPEPGQPLALRGTIGMWGGVDAPGLERWTLEAVDGLGRRTPLAAGGAPVEEQTLATWPGAASSPRPRLVVHLVDRVGRELRAERVLDPQPPPRDGPGPRIGP